MPGSKWQLARLGFNEESEEDYFQEFLQECADSAMDPDLVVLRVLDWCIGAATGIADAAKSDLDDSVRSVLRAASTVMGALLAIRLEHLNLYGYTAVEGVLCKSVAQVRACFVTHSALAKWNAGASMQSKWLKKSKRLGVLVDEVQDCSVELFASLAAGSDWFGAAGDVKQADMAMPNNVPLGGRFVHAALCAL